VNSAPLRAQPVHLISPKLSYWKTLRTPPGGGDLDPHRGPRLPPEGHQVFTYRYSYFLRSTPRQRSAPPRARGSKAPCSVSLLNRRGKIVSTVSDGRRGRNLGRVDAADCADDRVAVASDGLLRGPPSRGRPRYLRSLLRAPAWGDIQLGVVSRYRDDLPSISVSRLRALDVITAETTTFSLQLGDVEQTVAIALRRFPNGGSWSLFICPTCGHRAQTLRVLDREIVCRDCCERKRIRHRASTMSVRQRAEHRIPKLHAMIERTEPARLKPVLWGKMERRKRLQAALARAEFVVAQHQLAELTKGCK
jgi:hypothetical protein